MGSTTCFRTKKDKSLRFYVDCKRLSSLSRRDFYPIPEMDECVNSFSKATVFTTLDANSIHWQIEFEDEDRDKSAFTSHYGLYRIVSMMFCLKNAPETFRKTLDVIFARVKLKFVSIYLDDIVISQRRPKSTLTMIKKCCNYCNV